MSARLNYFPALDGVRGICVLAVMVSHFFAWVPGMDDIWAGGIGVRVFFVLSGFLITRILLDYRDRNWTIRQAAKTFYWRRTLRLAPPFYFAIFLSAAIGISNMRADWLIHTLYLSNFLISFRGEWTPVGHLWSLAVEEQFYLLWFLIVVCLPQRLLAPAIGLGILIGPIFRLALHMTHYSGLISPLPPSVFDCLAIGALIGTASIRWPSIFQNFARPWVFVFCLAASAIVLTGPAWLNVAFFPLTISLGASAVIAAAVNGRRWTGWLNLAPLRDTGKISYGLYVYHLFLPDVFSKFSFYIGNPLLHGLCLVAASYAIAITSWFVIEKPLMSLKSRKFINDQSAGSAGPAASSAPGADRSGARATPSVQ